MGKFVPTVVFDFDGVIHSYKSGWKGMDVIPDPPVPGIAEAIESIRAAGYRVVVVSTRCASYEGLYAVGKYLEDNGIQVDSISMEKPPAIAYIDDRAICFDGNPEGLLEQIQGFKPWYQKSRGFVPGDDVWVIERDEEGAAVDLSGYVFLAYTQDAIIATTGISDLATIEGVIQYHINETILSYDTDLCVFPEKDCFYEYEEAHTAYLKESGGNSSE